MNVAPAGKTYGADYLGPADQSIAESDPGWVIFPAAAGVTVYATGWPPRLSEAATAKWASVLSLGATL